MNNKNNQTNLFVFVGMGFELVGSVLVLIYIGQLIDKEMGWPGVGVASGAIIALVAWFYHLIILLKKIS
jgi:hypothetical protein